MIGQSVRGGYLAQPPYQDFSSGARWNRTTDLSIISANDANRGGLLGQDPDGQDGGTDSSGRG